MICSIIAMVFTAYFHIEIAWVTAVSIFFLAIWYERSWRILGFLGAHLLGGIILLAPYWSKILANHGIALFLHTFSTGYSEPLASIGILLIPLFTDEKIFQVLAVLAALGVYACITTRQLVPVFWLILITLIDPRSIHRSAVFPEALLIAVSLDIYIIQGLRKILEGLRGADSLMKERKLFTALPPASFPYSLVGGILTYAFILSALQQATDLNTFSLSNAERSAFAWVETNTSPDAAFLIMPTSSFWEGDWISEWFPALTNRRSVLTVQGYEWVPNRYTEKITAYEELARCIESDQPCYAAWQTKYKVRYDYLMIPKRSGDSIHMTFHLQKVLGGCSQAFENEDIVIYQYNQR
jgi:hypothetical protein